MTDTEVDREVRRGALAVSVDNALCQGHARCWHLAPEFFTLDDEGYCDIGTGKPVPVELEGKVLAGVDACPEHALTIDEVREA
jgi:ferredoxin